MLRISQVFQSSTEATLRHYLQTQLPACLGGSPQLVIGSKRKRSGPVASMMICGLNGLVLMLANGRSQVCVCAVSCFMSTHANTGDLLEKSTALVNGHLCKQLHCWRAAFAKPFAFHCYVCPILKPMLRAIQVHQCLPTQDYLMTSVLV